MSPTRFPAGLSTAKKTALLGDFMLPDVTKAYVYFDDFNYYRATDWNITQVGSGSEDLTAVDGGALAIVTDSNASDFENLQKVGESFLFEPGKKLWFETRLKTSDVSNSLNMIGLVNISTNDGVFFNEMAGGGLRLFIEKNAVSTLVNLPISMVDDTFIRLGYVYDGKDKVTIFVDGVAVGSASDLVNLPDDEELAIDIKIETFTDSAATLTIDYIVAAKER